MSQSWDTAITDASNFDDFASEVNDRTNTLRSSWSGTTLPSSPTPVLGQVSMHENGGGTNIDMLMVYSDPDTGGEGWHEVGSFLHNDLEHYTATSNGAGQLIRWGFERTSSDPTPSANNVGQQIHHTGISKGKVVADASTIEVIMSGSNADLIRTDLPLESWTLGSTPPTANPIGSTPAVPAYLFDAVGETMAIGVRVPAGFSGDADLTLRLFFALDVTETANDDLDITVDLVSVTPDQNEALNKTSTQATGTTDIGSNTAQYAQLIVDVTLDYNDATNPIAAGDWLALEFHLTNVTGVAAANFLGGQLLTPFGTKITE